MLHLMKGSRAANDPSTEATSGCARLFDLRPQKFKFYLHYVQ